MYQFRFSSFVFIIFVSLVGAFASLVDLNYFMFLSVLSIIYIVVFSLFAFYANKNLLDNISAKIKINLIVRAILSYIPLFVVLLFGVYAQAYVSYIVRDELYDEKIVLKGVPAEKPDALFFGGRDFEADVRLTVSTNAKQSAAALKSEFSVIADQLQREVQNKRKEVPNAFGAAFDRDLIAGRCNWKFRWACNGINNSYRNSVRVQNAKLQAQLNDYALRAANGDARARDEASKAIDQYEVVLLKVSERILDVIFQTLSISQIFAVLGLLGALVKSLGYFYARWTLSGNAVTQSFSSKKMRSTRGDFVLPVQSNNLDIDLTGERAFYVSTSLNFLGDIERKAIPLPWSMVGKRLVNGIYVLHEIVRPQRIGSISKIESDIKDQFVEITLSDNEEIFFRTEYLCGFTDIIRFIKYINFRFMGLIFGKLFYVSAMGPGKIALLVPGGCCIVAQNQEFLQHRIVAWKNTAKFSVRSSLDLKDLYFSGISISASVGRTCIIENATTKMNRRYISRFFRRFLWPL